MTIQEQIRAFIIDNFLFGDADHLENDASLSGSGYIDSTGVIELVAFLEKNLGLQIQDDEIIPDNLDSVNRICQFIVLKQAGQVVPRLQVSMG